MEHCPPLEYLSYVRSRHYVFRNFDVWFVINNLEDLSIYKVSTKFEIFIIISQLSHVMLVICQCTNNTCAHLNKKFLSILLNLSIINHSINHISDFFFVKYTLQLFYLTYHWKMLLNFYIALFNYDLFSRNKYKFYLLSELFFILKNINWWLRKKLLSNEDHFYTEL